MSRTRLATRLFLLSLGLLLALGLGWGIALDRSLKARLLKAEDTRLQEQAQLVQLLLVDTPDAGLDALADLVGAASDTRLSIIDQDGWVRGDSELDAPALQQLDRHDTRPEVAQALAGERGLSSRTSDTLNQDMRYLALPTEHSGQRWVVRSAAPLDAIDSALSAQRRTLAFSGLSALAVALFMSGLASWQASLLLEQALVRTHERSLDTRPQPDEDAAEALETAITALSAERDRFRAVLEGLDVAVIALDHGHIIRVVNSAAGPLLRVDQSKLGQSIFEAIPLPQLRELLEDTDEDDEVEVIEIALPGATTVQLRMTPAPGGTVLLFQDLTRLRRLENLRRDFVSNVSHELRTPIAIIRANAETLLDEAIDDGPEPTRMLVGAVLRSSERLSALISDLLEISRIEAGKMPVRLEVLDLTQILHRLEEPMEELAHKEQVGLSCRVPPDLQVLADPKALQTVLSNLVTNGLKYTPSGGAVQIIATLQDDMVRLEVHDSGPGVAIEHRERIFERFYRVDKGRSREVGGTGLGLAIVKHMVRAMNGQVGVGESTVLGGAVFWLELPSVSS